MRHALCCCLVLYAIALGAELGPILMNPSQSPQVVVELTAPKSINLGKPLVVEIVVKNTGSRPAERVRVEQELPASVRLLKTEPEGERTQRRVSWSLGSLAAGSERWLKLTLEAVEEGEFTCQPVVSHSPAATTSKLTWPRLALRQKQSQEAVLGEEVALVIEVSNPGTGPASGVILQHRLPPGLQHPRGDYLEKDVGELAPGESKDIALSVKAATKGSQVSQVTAKGDDGLEAKLEAVIRVGQPDLRLTLTGPGQRYLNTEAIFTIEVKNPGDAPARQVQIINALPEDLRFDSASDGGQFDKTTRIVTWTLDPLVGGANKLLNLKTTPVRTGVMTCRVTGRAEPRLEGHADATLEVLGVPALLLEVVDADDPLAVGEETVYEIRVKNQGSASNTRVQIIALLPDGLALVRAEGETPHRSQGKQVIFEPLDELKAEGEVVYRLKVRGTTPGDYRTRVQLQSEQLRIPVCEEESTKVYRD